MVNIRSSYRRVGTTGKKNNYESLIFFVAKMDIKGNSTRTHDIEMYEVMCDKF